MSEHRPTPENTNPNNLDVFEIAEYMLGLPGYMDYGQAAKRALLGRLSMSDQPRSLSPEVGQRYIAEDFDPDNPEYFVVFRQEADGTLIMYPEGHDPNEDGRSWVLHDEDDE